MKKSRRVSRTTGGLRGRLARSLGGNDPRGHRNPQSDLNEPTAVARPLSYDKKGRLALEPIDRVSMVSGNATLEDLIAAHNGLIARLKAGGLMKE